MRHAALAEYRFFVLNAAEKVEASVYALCADDEEATVAAADIGGGAAVEVWDVGRFVAKVAQAAA